MTAVVADPEEKQHDKPPLWWRIARGTAVGTVKVARVAYIEGRYVYGVTKTRTQLRYRRWKAERNFTADDMPEIDEVPSKRRRLMRAQYLCMACTRKFSSPYGLNKHFQNVHASEKKRRPPEPQKILGRDGTEKVLVRIPQARSARTSGTTTTAVRSTSSMSTIAQALKTAWARMAEARPYKLSEIRADMVGLEQVFGGFAAEAIRQYRAHLIRNVGFDPITVQRLVKATGQLEEAGKSFSAVIAAIDEYYAADIKAAKQRQGGMQPSDSTLTS